MPKKYEDHNVDYRTIELNIRRGNITRKEYEDFLKSLPDLSGQYEELPAYKEPEEEETEDASGDLTFTVV